jgi:hypothetical protein
MESGTTIGLPQWGIRRLSFTQTNAVKPGLGRGRLPNSALYRETRPRGPAGEPGSVIALVRLRRLSSALLPSPTQANLRTSVCVFFRHRGIFPSDVGSFLRPSPSWNRRLPPTTPTQAREHVGRNTLSLIVQMSSDRLFLDQVGRHQSLSLLHRRDQINMHSPDDGSKGDISTLPRWGHFYFALTECFVGIDAKAHRSYTAAI